MVARTYHANHLAGEAVHPISLEHSFWTVSDYLSPYAHILPTIISKRSGQEVRPENRKHHLKNQY